MKILIPALLLRPQNYWVIALTVIRLWTEANIETKYLNDEKTHKAIKGKLFKRLNNVSKELQEVELAKSKIEHHEPMIVGFLILQYAKLSTLQLYFNFCDIICDLDKLEE